MVVTGPRGGILHSQAVMQKRFANWLLNSVFAGLGISSAVSAQIVGLAPEFEVATVKVGTAPKRPCGECKGQFNQDPGLLDYRGVRLADVIELAYGIGIEPDTGPKSIWTARYDIRVRIPPDTATNQVPAMLRKLLADRFKLAARVVTQERKEYWLIVGEKGLNTRSGAIELSKKGDRFNANIIFTADPPRLVEMTNWTMDQFAAALSTAVDRPVVNKTGLRGNFNIKVGYTPDGGYHGLPHGVFDPFPNVPYYPHQSAPPVTEAIQEQLGLKLQPHVTSIDVLVIDRGESVPVEN
jgi:uncharacterized protein (TIGR03435 family)